MFAKCVTLRLGGPALTLLLGFEATAQPLKTAEQVYKNIQVFKGVPASQLQQAMWFMRASLGVRCSHCHTNPFDSDALSAKHAARRMILMVRNINRDNFAGKLVVTCNTCHRGQPRPSAVPVVEISPVSGLRTAKADPSEPTVDQVLERYVQALGGRAALEKLTTRAVKGSRVNVDGSIVPTEIYQKAPNKVMTVVTYPNVTFYSGFNGLYGWTRDSQGVGDRTVSPDREGEFYYGFQVKEQYPGLKLAGQQKIGERRAHVLEARSSEDTVERFYFDLETGLLLRRYFESNTPLGPLPTQIDYEDYRLVDNVRLPFLIRWTSAGFVWSRKINDVQHNVPIDEARFDGTRIP